MVHEEDHPNGAGVECGSSARSAAGAADHNPSSSKVTIRTIPVILSGGAGARLWPSSSDETPKQFLQLTGSQSLFREALGRVRDRTRFSAPIIVASARHADLCEKELAGEGGEARLILEPCARNTAAAILTAATVAREVHGDDALLLVMPSDHVMLDVTAFHQAVRTGEAAARAGYLVIFGVEPNGPETGYGYIHVGAEMPSLAGVREAVRFVEKPPRPVAERMIAEGDHLWNAGIFLFRAGALLAEAASLVPEIAATTEQALASSKREGMRIMPSAAPLEKCPAESFDRAVVERSRHLAVVPMSPGWSDLGSWDALAVLSGQQQTEGPVTALECSGCYIRSDGPPIAALGLHDLIVVASGKGLLILPRGRSQEVRKLIEAMESHG